MSIKGITARKATRAKSHTLYALATTFPYKKTDEHPSSVSLLIFFREPRMATRNDAVYFLLLGFCRLAF